MTRVFLTRVTAVLLSAALLGGAGYLLRVAYFAPRVITADFVTATSIYPGDQVRVAGVRVGSISAIEPQGEFTRLTMTVDRRIAIPADAKAVIVAQNLISARYVQLTPAYPGHGPTMAAGTRIPLNRTAVPVEWDEVKDQLMRLAEALGPDGPESSTPTARFLTSAADAMADNGAKLRETLAQLSGAGRIIAGGSANLVDIIENLQTFITALRTSDTQIVQLQDRLATLSSVLDGSRSDLDGALTNISEVVGEVRRFVAEVRDPAAEQVRSLAAVTQNVVEHKRDVEQILHVAPTAIANTLNMFDPRDGGATGIFTFVNMSNPLQFICGAIGAIENVTAAESAKLCKEQLGPALSQMSFNSLPFPINPLLTSVPGPEHLKYTEPRLLPGGAGPKPGPPETPPAVSAYTGVGDVPPPPGYGPVTEPGAKDFTDLLVPPPPSGPAEQPAGEPQP